MAGYCALISDGIAALDIKTSEARREYYDRARAILADHFRKADPPLSDTFIKNERQALEDAIGKVEADAVGRGRTLIINETQSEYNEDHIRSAALKKAWVQLNAKVQMRRERRFAFWGFLIVYAFWIGDLFYERPTFSDWYDWLRLGGVIFFGALTVLSYFILQTNWSVEEEERAYIAFTPIILAGAVLLSVALYWAFGHWCDPIIGS
jgi:hypothetical protein